LLLLLLLLSLSLSSSLLLQVLLQLLLTVGSGLANLAIECGPVVSSVCVRVHACACMDARVNEHGMSLWEDANASSRWHESRFLQFQLCHAMLPSWPRTPAQPKGPRAS
jgi:hypothetical protein